MDPRNNQNGAMLIDGKDVRTWADAMSKVITDKGFRSELVSQGLERAAELNWRRCAQETVIVYHAVVEES